MTIDDSSRNRADGLSRWFCRAPLIIAALLICGITGSNLARLVPARAPRNPMEATEVLEAWRSLHGMPVYELTPDGHSAHFYGALVPWVQGAIFRWVGPNNISGRVITLVSALTAVTVIAMTMRGQRSAWYLLVAWAALLGVNNRSYQYLSENRPDLTALLFGTLGLLAIGFGQENRRGGWVALGSACLVAGFFFKQTVIVFAAVSLVALVLQGRRPDRSELVLAMVPPAVSGGAVLALRVLSPTVYHYMVAIPGAYRIDYPVAAKCVWEFLAESPLFLVLIGEWLFRDGRSLWRDPRVRWLLALLAVALPFGALSFAKYRGAANSMLPALLGIMAFCALRLPGLLRYLENPEAPRTARLMFGGLVALLLLITTFPHPGVFAYRSRWDGVYAQAVAAAADLPGTVVCPEDPTIPLYAKHRAGRSIFTELDAHPVHGVWPHALPETMRAEFRAADYVVDVTAYWDDCVNEKLLRELGFAPVEGVPLDPACYRIWRRAASDSRSSPPRTAWQGTSSSVPD